MGEHNLVAPPRYCSTQCYETRIGTTDATAVMRPSERRYAAAIATWTHGTEQLPTMTDGAPYRKVRPIFLPSFRTLHPRTQNAIMFWRWFVQNTTMESPVTAAVLAARGIAPDHPTGIPRANTYWPFIRGIVPNAPIVEMHVEGYWAERHRKQMDAEPTKLIKDLDRARLIRINGATTNADMKFKREYMDKREDLGNNSRLRLMCMRYLAFSEEPRLTQWLAIDKESESEVEQWYAKLSENYLKALSKKRLPWSPDNLVKEMQAEPQQEDRLTTLMEMEMYR